VRGVHSMPKNLIGLAAWLHRQSRFCQMTAAASTDSKVAELALADADLFQRASDIIKEAADERRKRRALVVEIGLPARMKAASRDTRRPA
jgi:hypothetical protein